MVIRERLQREIERLGIELVIHRQGYVSDGSNGYIPGSEITFNVKGILKSSSSGQTKSFIQTDGGKTYNVSNTLSVLFADDVKFQMGDWFVHGGIKYTVRQISNVGEQNVYWLLSLSTEIQEVEEYGK